MTGPTLEELRRVTQPPETLGRRNAEHWLARLVLRRVSLRVTRLLIRLPVTPNQLTAGMIVVGLVAAAVAALPGLATALLAWALVLGYFLLDLCDGEVARWRRRTSVTGVYLDRVGHYLVEAALLTAYGVRAGAQSLGGWSTVGVATGLLVVLAKAETDLVDVARVRSGMATASDASAEPRSAALGRARRAAAVLRVHQLTGALESSFLLAVVAAYDAAAGGLGGQRLLAGALFGIAAVLVVLHLVSILASSRLR